MLIWGEGRGRKERTANHNKKETDMTNEKKIESVESVESVEIEATNKGQTMASEKQVEVKDGFRVADTIGSYYEIRYGWGGSVCETTTQEQLVDCFDDAKRHGLGFVEIEFNVEDFNEIWAFITFSPNPKRGRISVDKLLCDDELFDDFYDGVKDFINYDLRPINYDTSRAMKWLYDGERYNDEELHDKATDLSMRLDEIARSWIELLKGSATDDDRQRIEDNTILESCEMTRWEKFVEEIISRKTHKNN